MPNLGLNEVSVVRSVPISDFSSAKDGNLGIEGMEGLLALYAFAIEQSELTDDPVDAFDASSGAVLMEPPPSSPSYMCPFRLRGGFATAAAGLLCVFRLDGIAVAGAKTALAALDFFYFGTMGLLFFSVRCAFRSPGRFYGIFCKARRARSRSQRH
jgi:hypothetical protein